MQSYGAVVRLQVDYKKDSCDFSLFYNDVTFFIMLKFIL